MAIFGDSEPAVPVSVVEQFLAALEKERERSHAVTLEALAIKRHEMQMVPTGWTPPTDPFSALGPKTQAAVEGFAGHDAELRQRLIGEATNLAALFKFNGMDPDEIDESVAERIAAGDT